MQYNKIWEAVDKLAKSQGLSPSGLAKKSGLDATTFNKSKRVRSDGKKRWPSLDSINKITEACNINMEQFLKIIDSEESKICSSAIIPFNSYSQISTPNAWDNENLILREWNKISFPEAKDNLYAIELDTKEFAPYYQHGATLIISQNSQMRKGDRIVIFNHDNSIIICEFVRRTAKSLEVISINDKKEFSLDIPHIKLINRIVWASQ